MYKMDKEIAKLAIMFLNRCPLGIAPNTTMDEHNAYGKVMQALHDIVVKPELAKTTEQKKTETK